MKAGIFSRKLDGHVPPYLPTFRHLLEKHKVKVDYSHYDTTVAEDEQDLEATYNRNKKLILTNDFLLAEVTEYSLGVGYLIADALNNRKPVLALYNKKLGKKASTIIKSSTKSKLLDYYEYDDDNLEAGITAFISKAKNISEAKYILLIPPEIDQYLDWASYEYHLPKSQIVRDSIQTKMKANKEWNQHLKSQKSGKEKGKSK